MDVFPIQGWKWKEATELSTPNQLTKYLSIKHSHESKPNQGSIAMF